MAPRDTSIACLTFMRSSTFGVGLFLQSPWMLSWGKLVCENIQQTLLCPTPELYYLSAPRSLLDAETPVNRFIIHIQIWISLLHWCKRRTVKTTLSWWQTHTRFSPTLTKITIIWSLQMTAVGTNIWHLWLSITFHIVPVSFRTLLADQHRLFWGRSAGAAGAAANLHQRAAARHTLFEEGRHIAWGLREGLEGPSWLICIQGTTAPMYHIREGSL